MRAIIDIQIAADIRIALSEHELAVWAHLSQYNSDVICAATSEFPRKELEAVRNSLRAKLGSAKRRVDDARKMLDEMREVAP